MRRGRVEMRNRADTLVYQTEKNLKELEAKISGDQKAQLEAAIERTREALKKDDDQEVQAAMDDLQQRWHQVAREIYQATEAGAPSAEEATAGARTEGPAEEEGVIEADYEVVDEEK